MSDDDLFCWCCGLPLMTDGDCSLCDMVGVSCDPPHECMKKGGAVIALCHDNALDDLPVDGSVSP